MGLHRYNLFQGTNYQLILVKKYHYRLILAASTYYITLVAMDPSTSLLHTFQTKIDEGQIAGFVLKCNIARIRAETNKDERAYSCYFPGSMPEWPTEDPFDNRKRFYVLNKSEVQDNDWIRLYLELAVAKYRSINMDPDLSDLKIVNVAIDTSQDLSEGLNAKNATVYISYKDSCEARVGKDVDRIAIVRRTFCERTRQFTLRGRHQSLEIIPKKRADQGEDDSCEAGVGEDADRVRSSFNEHTRRLSPMGQQHQSSVIIPKKGADQGEDDSCEAGVGEDEHLTPNT
ncbi:PREDICTED: UPF0725 protein At3g57210-like [Camelina sativa]|uniref:UPF0725 protein At3g57210-like n=1 Tax=Camelina sativa TaxID=90675 RepID=A0ABM1RST2_CAMSA|nr:PREDICTED: UPF0725 protein At3g57210-like [Camelina sativa]